MYRWRSLAQHSSQMLEEDKEERWKFQSNRFFRKNNNLAGKPIINH
jgi:hypothetical protein